MRIRTLLIGLTAPFALSGCLAGAAVNLAGETVEAGIGITGKAVSTTAKTTGAVAGAVIPGGGDDDKDGKKKD